MTKCCSILLAGFAILVAATARADSDPDTLPMPRRFNADDDPISKADLERTLANLRTERDALSSDLQALQKKRSQPVAPSMEEEQRLFQMHLQKTLNHLQQSRSKAPRAFPVTGPLAQKSAEAEASKQNTLAKQSEGNPEPTAVPVNALAQAHALLRVQQYDEALATFQQIDVKGKKAEERAPIQYLKACCLLHLGRSKEASELFTEVANYRGDEVLAGYAQWTLDALRWQREVDRRLQEIRDRRSAVEKR
jgi:tetratricopeptide (TPR) repeat protein